MFCVIILPVIFMQIINVAITGAPCSGKTTIIKKAIEYYRKQGITVLYCPESATVALENGSDRTVPEVFEYEIAKIQKSAEARILAKANKLNAENVLVLYDRGLTDCFSYVPDSERFSEMVGTDIYSTWSRYDAVIMLETTAAKGFIENSSIRTESVDDAVLEQNKLLDVYIGHPHFRFIKVCDSIDEKLLLVTAQIDMLLNDVELEKKFLIAYPDLKALSKYKPFKAEISQTYLLCQNGSHRVRRRTTNGIPAYFETLKIRITGSKSVEHESMISKEKYETLLKSADPDKNTIVKDRYCFLYDGQYFELDVFPFWQDKAFVELELTGEDDPFQLPPEIMVIKDVSDDPRYKNNYLARLKL